MKIHQLPLGARFEFEGQEYVKTGPMFGTAREGGTRLIPKYAVLKCLDNAPQGNAGKAKDFSRQAVLDAFDVFCEQCRSLVPEDRQEELASAREHFLKALATSS